MNKIEVFIDFIKNLEVSNVINLIIALVSAIVFILLSPLVSYGIIKLFFRKQSKENIKNSSIYRTMKIFLALTGIFVAGKIMDLNQAQNDFGDKCFTVVIIWTIAKIIMGIFEARELLIEKSKKEDIRKNAFFTTVVSNILKTVLYIIAIYLTLKEFGYDIAGLATGLGITGAVVALAAQDFIKQIISGLSIFTDKPFNVGDWIDIEEISGTVEDITIKSTKIRTVEDTIITVPNDLITSTKVTNWGRIDKRVFRANLKFSLETEERTIEKIINRIKFILRYNEDIIEKSINIQVLKIEEDAINIDIYLETTITDYKMFREFCNKINLTILNILETQGVKLSYPGRNIYIKESNMISEKGIVQKEKNKESLLNKKENNTKKLSKEENTKKLSEEKKSNQEVKKIKPAKILK